MKRKHAFKSDFTIDNINDINKEPEFVEKRDNELASAPLRLIVPGLSSLRTNPPSGHNT